eukprot:CAMPEP_0179066968 /NCGR_PEP_ID=MMETSP0796-20121207/29249_1 /TAXON_ID=73915 /ORGANISM="Pyrodinium bahamense, Strain pbaha01" /LENGTH=414 /DNA_ID=CAMNT_0020763987 /DNA_START=45 /DNA_END=1286 /DNA_ORIENTATION=-
MRPCSTGSCTAPSAGSVPLGPERSLRRAALESASASASELHPGRQLMRRPGSTASCPGVSVGSAALGPGQPAPSTVLDQACAVSNEHQPMLEAWQSAFIGAVADLEEAVRSLSDRIGQGESETTALENCLGQLVNQVLLLEGRGVRAKMSDRESLEEQVGRVEAQLQEGEERLGTQEHSRQTVESVVMSMSDLVGVRIQLESVWAGSGPPAETVARPPLQLEPLPLPEQRQTPQQQQQMQQPRQGQEKQQQQSQQRQHEQAQQQQAQHFHLQLQYEEAGQPAEEQFPSLQRSGQQPSIGGVSHPQGCRPCSCYCFSKGGCRKGYDCEYCYMAHLSRSARRLHKAERGVSPVSGSESLWDAIPEEITPADRDKGSCWRLSTFWWLRIQQRFLRTVVARPPRDDKAIHMIAFMESL